MERVRSCQGAERFRLDPTNVPPGVTDIRDDVRRLCAGDGLIWSSPVLVVGRGGGRSVHLVDSGDNHLFLLARMERSVCDAVKRT